MSGQGSPSRYNRSFGGMTGALIVTVLFVIAFVAWLGVHLYYLAGVGNRAKAVVAWVRSFIGTARPGFDEVVHAPRPEPARIAG